MIKRIHRSVSISLMLWIMALLRAACTSVSPVAPSASPTSVPQSTPVAVPSTAAVASPSPATVATLSPGPPSPPPAAKPAHVGIDIGDNFFSPKSATVAAGTTVVRQNRGGGEVQHNVVAEDSSFASGDVGPGNTFMHLFNTPRRFAYVCAYHVPQGMTGEVIVE